MGAKEREGACLMSQAHCIVFETSRVLFMPNAVHVHAMSLCWSATCTCYVLDCYLLRCSCTLCDMFELN